MSNYKNDDSIFNKLGNKSKIEIKKYIEEEKKKDKESLKKKSKKTGK